INTPADAFGALAVGAVRADGTIASFSSRGPTADGRVKPDIVTMGVSTRVAALATTAGGDSSIYTFISGTSASAPLATSAAALLLSARPELTPSQVFDALRNTADRAANPDNTYGWGLVNVVDALQYPTLSVDNIENRIELFLASPGGIAPGSPTLYFKRQGESTFTAQPMELTRSFQSTTRGLYAADIPVLSQSALIRFYVQVTDSVSGPTTIPVQAPLLTFAFNDGVGTLLPPVIIPAEFRLYQNFPNPFNQGTFIRYDLEEPRTVTLDVFNILGQRVATLVSGVFQAAGRYEVRLNDSNLASGVYFYTLQAGDLAQTRKMVLIR
ncbi:MAG TPA: S8 family serine peptidase, partial [Bacteroidota bacterium]